jgi:hypothetical protein
MEATLNHQVMDEKRECGELYACAFARLAGPEGAGARHAREWSVEIRPSLCGGTTFFCFFLFGC